MLTLVSGKNNVIPQKVSPVSKLGLRDTTNSLFIINALLVAIMKDPASSSVNAKMTISKLRQSMLEFENNESVSEVDFFKLSDKFYSSLSQLTGFKRVTETIRKEKVHIERALRLSLRDNAGYNIMISLYAEILIAMQENRTGAALSSLSNLVQILEGYVFVATENHPDSSRLKNPASSMR